ncbi:helix-turn-helix transcriptional regulator [Secundilactobacillus kimchicus]|uniref:helix-turn-helix transcriptional regulator n=1 Tax=Secundilactobacillus kimchicus TaxID=528209 RepID=UPI001C032D96|nr:AraC family transcriptional regulator [Secundilactobacillus kimchicus]
MTKTPSATNEQPALNFIIRFSTLELDLAYFLRNNDFNSGTMRIKKFTGNDPQVLEAPPADLLSTSLLGLIGHLTSDGLANQTNGMAYILLRNRLIRTYTALPPTAHDFMAAVHHVFAEFYQLRQNGLPSVEMTAVSKQVRLVMYYIDLNLSQKLTATGILKELGLESKYTTNLFRREVHMSISAYIQHTKLQEAKRRLLYTSQTIGRIATSLGYYDTASFTNRFNTEFKMSPSVYREINKVVGSTDY